MVLVGAVVALTLVVALLRELGDGHLLTAGGLLLPVAFVAVWLTFVVRLYLAGVYRDERGLLLRYIFRSRLLPWSEVTGFDVRPTWLFGGPTRQRGAWVLTRDGAVETPVRLHAPVRSLEKRAGPVLSATDFNLMLNRLGRAHAAAQACGGVTVR